MEVNDLRIGNDILCCKDNYIGTSKEEWVEVQVYASLLVDIEEDIVSVKPIHATETWLLDVGFSEIKVKRNQLGITKCFNLNGLELIQHYQTPGFGFEALDSIIDYQYTHELQNLYYSLTGNELNTISFKSDDPIINEPSKWFGITLLIMITILITSIIYLYFNHG